MRGGGYFRSQHSAVVNVLHRYTNINQSPAARLALSRSVSGFSSEVHEEFSSDVGEGEWRLKQTLTTHILRAISVTGVSFICGEGVVPLCTIIPWTKSCCCLTIAGFMRKERESNVVESVDEFVMCSLTSVRKVRKSQICNEIVFPRRSFNEMVSPSLRVNGFYF